MSWMHYYTITAGVYAAYVLSLMHAKGHTGPKNLAMALTTALFWPLAAGYGAYLRHFSPNDGKEELPPERSVAGSPHEQAATRRASAFEEVEREAFEQATVRAGGFQPIRSPFRTGGYLYSRDADRFTGWMLAKNVHTAHRNSNLRAKRSVEQRSSDAAWR